MFTPINSENAFNKIKALCNANNIDAEFIYDCGSVTEAPSRYVTNEFKKHLKISSVASRMSKCTGVYTNSPLTLPEEKTLFEVQFDKAQPVSETDFFQFLLKANKENTLSSYLAENRMAFLVSLGFEPGYNKIKPEAARYLRLVHDMFWDFKHAGTLSQFDTPESNIIIDKDNFEAGSYEYGLASLVVEGNRINLPKQQLSHYAAIKKAMTKAGGKYKKLGFDFPATTDLTALLNTLLGGKKVDIKKDFQFFETPEEEASECVEEADIQSGERWCEPSAGKGRIAQYAMAKSSEGTLIEIMPDNIAHLNTNFSLPLLTKDFLSCTEAELGGKFDKFIANPPFTKNQDIHHFLHMVGLLNDNGRVVCITSSHWEHSKTHLCQAFKAWLKHCGAKVTVIKAGAFKSSGTSIETRRIVLDKASVSISFEDFSKQYKLDTAA